MYSAIVEPLRDRSNQSDSQLIQAALAGVEDAYAEIVRRYEDRLVTSIRSDGSCAESAEDIVQDAFVQAFQNLDSFRSESSLYTWLYRIALNSRRYYKRNRHRTMSLESTLERAGHAWVIEPHVNLGDPVEAWEEREQVRAALARLDDHHRDILVLREFEGCDYQAISKALNVTMGTVRSRLSRARAQLRKELFAYWTSAPLRESRPLRGEAWRRRHFSLTA